MNPEEFVDEILPKDMSFEWQRKFLVEFLKMPKYKRNIVLSPRRGDRLSNTRAMLYLYNYIFNEAKENNL